MPSSSPPTALPVADHPLLLGFEPPGALKSLVTGVLSWLTVWIALYQAAQLFLGCLRNGGKGLWRKDRSAQPLPASVATFHHEFIVTNGIRLHAVSPGRQPSKPLMLMLHGFPECWYSWRQQMVEFQADYDVVAVDMRGYGLSDKPKGSWRYSVDLLAADVEGAVHALGHTSCTLVAHDWGGAVAWVVAALYGTRLVDRLIVLAAPHFGLFEQNSDLDQKRKSWYMLFFQVPWIPEWFMSSLDARMISYGFECGSVWGTVRPGAVTPEDIEVYKQAWQRPGVATAAINYYRANLSSPPPAVVAALRRPIAVPSLLLWAEQDGALGQQLLRNMDQVVPGISVVLMKQCSHWIQQEQPRELAAHMRTWLKAHPLGAGSKKDA